MSRVKKVYNPLDMKFLQYEILDTKRSAQYIYLAIYGTWQASELNCMGLATSSFNLHN